MIEASIINLLAADTDLQALLSEFEGAPAIFSGAAPQKAERPYLVIDIDNAVDSTVNLAVTFFDITIDIYHRQESGKEVREIAERIEFVCDREVMDNDARYSAIRLYYEDGRTVENTDIKIRHYVARLSARAGRKKWIEATAPPSPEPPEPTGKRFIALGRTNESCISPDGETWETGALPSTLFVDSAAGNDIIVAITGSDEIYASDDHGQTWGLSGTTPSGQYDLIHNTEKFLITAAPNFYTSIDGINWTATPTPGADTFREAVYGDGKTVAMGELSVAVSEDLQNWNTYPSPYQSTGWIDAAYGNGLYAFLEFDAAVTSTDGQTWQSRTLPSVFAWSRITYGAGVFVLIGSESFGEVVVEYSSDFVTWTRATLPEVVLQYNTYDMEYANGVFVAPLGGGANGVDATSLVSEDGINWAIHPRPDVEAFTITYG